MVIIINPGPSTFDSNTIYQFDPEYTKIQQTILNEKDFQWKLRKKTGCDFTYRNAFRTFRKYLTNYVPSSALLKIIYNKKRSFDKSNHNQHT